MGGEDEIGGRTRVGKLTLLALLSSSVKSGASKPARVDACGHPCDGPRCVLGEDEMEGMAESEVEGGHS